MKTWSPHLYDFESSSHGVADGSPGIQGPCFGESKSYHHSILLFSLNSRISVYDVKRRWQLYNFLRVFCPFFSMLKENFWLIFFVNVWQLDNIYYTYNALYISYYIWYNTSRCVFFVHWFYKAHFLWCLNITYSYAKSWLHLALFTHFGIF